MHFVLSLSSLFLDAAKAVMPGRLALSGASSKYLHSMLKNNTVNTINYLAVKLGCYSARAVVRLCSLPIPASNEPRHF
jgi:hypothetical protein